MVVRLQLYYLLKTLKKQRIIGCFDKSNQQFNKTKMAVKQWIFICETEQSRLFIPSNRFPFKKNG
jgi:hypothetical protein